MIAASMFACCFGSFFVCSIRFVKCVRFFSCICFLSLFLYCLCAVMLCCVGCFVLRSCSLCCFLMHFFVSLSHHAFRLGFGICSCCSMIWVIVFCMFCKCLSVVVYSCVLVMFCVMVCVICGMMLCLLLLYCAVESVGCACVCFLLSFEWKIVYVGRWSDIGGAIVPAVTCVSVIVVSTWSIIECVLCCGSYRVGVVIVVCRLFSISR